MKLVNKRGWSRFIVAAVTAFAQAQQFRPIPATASDPMRRGARGTSVA